MPPAPRQDIPEPVKRLAEAVGARCQPPTRVELAQSGKLRNLGADKWMRFSARQWIATARCEFSWCAHVGPLGAVHVEDALVDGRPVGRVSALGLFPIARAAASPELLKGQLMRYLAEIAWAPDAMLTNPHLHWQAVDEAHLQVSASIGAVAGSITIGLDPAGLPQRISGWRPAQEGRGFTEREWHGEFTDWREVDGRRIPHAGRVWWVLDAEPVEVWRGAISTWRTLPA